MKDDIEIHQPATLRSGTRCWFYPAGAPSAVECVVKAVKYVEETNKYIYMIQLVSEEGEEEVRYNVGGTALSIDRPPPRVFIKQEEVIGEKRNRVVPGNPSKGDEPQLGLATPPHSHPQPLSPFQVMQQIDAEDSQPRTKTQ